MKKKTALITGGAGFIGSELTKQLLAVFEEVIVVDNMVNGKIKNLHEVHDNPRLRIVAEDIRSIEKISPLIRQSNYIYHLACLGVRHSIHSPKENYDVNANGTYGLLEAAKGCLDKFVYVSTSEVYGTAKHVPMAESHPTFPLTVYGAGKLAGEALTRSFYETYEMPTVVVRPFNSYGSRSHHEGDSGEVIPKFMLRSLMMKPLLIFGDGTQTRDFTFVKDTAQGILKAGIHPRALGQTFNIGSGSEISIHELALNILKVTESSSTIKFINARPGDVLRLYSDSSHASNLLDFSITTSFANGLQHLLKWYKKEYTYDEISRMATEDIDQNWVDPEFNNKQHER